MTARDEEESLRSVALQNAQSILLARRRAEEALRKQSEWLRITLSSIGDAVISTDVEGRVTFMNRVAESLTGWPQAEAIGRPLPEVFHIVNEQTRQPVESPAARALREGALVELANHTWLIAREGTQRPIDDSAAPIWDDSGSPVGAVLVFRDVTERKQAEETQARLAAIVESSEDAIVSKTLDGVILSWNAGAERLFGYSPEEAIGRPITLIIPPERQDEEREILARLTRGERIDHFVTVRVSKHGRRIDISLTVSPIRDRTGRIIGASKIARDITHQKRVEAALKEADRRKDEFLALLAHELRNPLAPIRNAVGILRAKSPYVPELRWAREVIERQVEQMTRLVDDLLDVSRISRGKVELRKQRVGLSAVVSDAVEASRPLIEKWGHELTIALPPEPVLLDADPTRLAQVLLNLLNNAAKYTDQGGRIWLTAERDGGQVVVRVKDTGVGIAADMLPHVFEIFTQVDRSLERSQGGLGIGLTLVQRLVELHGGTVEAHSPGPDQGSEFVVRLPAAEELEGPEWPGAAGDGGAAPAQPRCRILVVDDNQDAADSLAMLLRIQGHEVRTAHDGLEAVGAAAAFEPNVVLMDIGLPKLNGYEAARRIRDLPGGDAKLLIALTGWGQEEDRRRAQEAGFDHHMTKPVELVALQNLLAESNLNHPERRR